MRYAVVGPGSVGSLITYSLNQSGIEPYIVFRTNEEARGAIQSGLKLYLPGQVAYDLRGFFVSYNDIPERSIDIAFICTKSYDVPTAINSLKVKLKKRALAISVQNGLGAFEVMKAMLSKAVTLALVLNCGAFREGYYKFVYSGCGESYLGGEGEKTLHSVKLVINPLTVLNVKLVEDITPYRWVKLAINAAVNPLTAVRRVRNGVILTDKYLRSLAFSVVKEVTDVAKSLGINLLKSPMEELVRVVEATKYNYSSMLQDILAGRRTEIDFINGAVVGRASAAGVKAPINKALWLLVKSIESVTIRSFSY